jgi:hypothetical protein
METNSFNQPPQICPWSPPEDADKPRLPYIAGFTVPIRRHVPRRPFGDDYGHGTKPYLPREYLFSVTQSELVVNNPPLDSDPPSQIHPETASLIITAPTVIGSAHGAQIATCTIVPQNGTGSKPLQAVVKIYDALYYRFSMSLINEPRDVVLQADQDYSREAAAYEFLQRVGQTAAFAPEYHGSWTFELPITYKGHVQKRPVRMIVIERLDGTTLRNALVRNDIHNVKDAFHYPEEYRLEILARAMEGLAHQLYLGVDQSDFAGRNVMIVPDTESKAEQITVAGLPLPRVVLIDYNNSYVFSLLKQPVHQDSSRPCNPLLFFWDTLLYGFSGWIPHEWQHSRKLMQQWLLQRFGTDEQKALYAPIEQELQFEEDD